jgi:gliding motility-associated-like protein
MANDDFKQRYVNRYAEMISTYLNCDFALAHFDSIVNHITPEMPNQVARWGGTMAGWQANLTYMRNQISNRCQYIANQGIINCYEVTGPYDLAFNVEPANSGTIRFNELTVPNYPWSGTYFGGVEGDIEATPATNYEFWYWEIFHSNLTSDSTQSLNSFLIVASDSIVAHFRIIETNPITYIIEPAGSGTVSINGISPASFPYTTIYNVGMPVSLSATPSPNYEFVWYEAIHHSFNPDSATIDASFVTDTSDTIIVHFQPLQTWKLTVLIDPPGAGKVNIDGNWLSTYPQTFTYFPGAVVSSDVIAFDDYLFSHWTLEQTALVNDSNNTINGCVIDTNDTLTAHFNLREIIPQTMYVPNSFTPNNDGLNDFFQCFHTETVGKGNVVIFNRWGEEVYRSGMLDFKWDGKYLNSDLPEDVYFYVLNYYLKADYYETAKGKIVLYR